MGARSYENFDLLIEAEGEGRYRVRVADCPVGDTPTSVFSLPFSPTELENLLLKLDPGRTGMRRITDRHTQATIDLGSGLFDAVFRDRVLVAWSRSKDAVWQEGRGLRLRLRFAFASSGIVAAGWASISRGSVESWVSMPSSIEQMLDTTKPAHLLALCSGCQPISRQARGVAVLPYAAKKPHTKDSMDPQSAT